MNGEPGNPLRARSLAIVCISVTYTKINEERAVCSRLVSRAVTVPATIAVPIAISVPITITVTIALAIPVALTIPIALAVPLSLARRFRRRVGLRLGHGGCGRHDLVERGHLDSGFRQFRAVAAQLVKDASLLGALGFRSQPVEQIGVRGDPL